jgi:hypothetical protein
MRLALTLTFLAAACGSDSDRPVGPGGGGGGGGTGGKVDAGGADGQSQGVIQGRLCLVNDLRTPSTCGPATGLGGIIVENAQTGARATSEDNGNFTLPAGAGASAQLHVAHETGDYRDVVVPIGLIDGVASGVELPLVPTLVWQDMIFVVGMNEPAGTASIASYFVRNGSAVTNVTVTAPAGTSGVPIYDGLQGPNDWAPGGGTGARGAAILLGVPVAGPTVDLVATPLGEENFTALGIPLESDALTFITVALP